MANRLKMAKVQSILTLHQRGWSQRRIARELGVHRETVARHIEATVSDSKPAKAPTGSRSACEPWRELILEKIQVGLSAQRIYQDLVCEHGFTAKYHSVRRFVGRLQSSLPLPMRRMECSPGEEGQVDFGSGALIIEPDGKRRRPHVFRIVLSYSRKSYSEVVYRQTTENFIRCLENAFSHFAGVPRTLVIDNLRAAVTRADWYEPEIHPKLQAFCDHYGIVILPTRPYTPRHKGKVEGGIKYVKENGLKGHVFASLQDENEHLLQWERRVADTRIHGTTRKQVGKLFDEQERTALQPLPAERFPFFYEAQRSVHRDGHVEVDKAYYSAPPEYMTSRVWVRWDSRLVRIFNHRFEQIALHCKQEPGRFSTQSEHIPGEKVSAVERGATDLLTKASLIGPATSRWSQEMIASRGVAGVRVLVGLISLAKRHPYEMIEQACAVAVTYQAFRLRTIRKLLERQAPPQREFKFLDEHPVIRPLSEYGNLVQQSFERNEKP